jgi:hypothetical protein
MSSFTTPLIVSPLDDGHRWELKELFEYHVGTKESTEVIRIPAGFITDFASVPRFLWGIIPPWDKYGKAAVVHDFCYGLELYPRKRCDEIFLEGMTVLNVPLWKRQTMYYAVRIFGQAVWDKHTKETIAERKKFLSPPI